MSHKILIIGLSGSGKTSLAERLVNELKDVEWFNADIVRKEVGDWDFSENGRIRQALRLSILANSSNAKYTIIDFIAPLPKQRDIVDADVVIWMDTVTSSNYPDTDKIFVEPYKYDFKFKQFSEIDINKIMEIL